jgi:glycosyltransferase involved in cell wall biosynthesis
VIQTMQQYDALCLCSAFSEMSPLVIQEAFAAGIPVIASNVYGNTEQIQHGSNGLLFAFKNIDSLFLQLKQCVENPGLLPGLKRNIIPPQTFTEVAEQYEALYRLLREDRIRL